MLTTIYLPVFLLGLMIGHVPTHPPLEFQLVLLKANGGMPRSFMLHENNLTNVLCRQQLRLCWRTRQRLPTTSSSSTRSSSPTRRSSCLRPWSWSRSLGWGKECSCTRGRGILMRTPLQWPRKQELHLLQMLRVGDYLVWLQESMLHVCQICFRKFLFLATFLLMQA